MADIAQLLIPAVGSLNTNHEPTSEASPNNNGAIKRKEQDSSSGSVESSSEEISSVLSYLWRSISSKSIASQPQSHPPSHSQQQLAVAPFGGALKRSRTPSTSGSSSIIDDVHSFFSRVMSPESPSSSERTCDSTVISEQEPGVEEEEASSVSRSSEDSTEEQHGNGTSKRRKKRSKKAKSSQQPSSPASPSQQQDTTTTRKCEELPDHILMATFQKVMTKGLQLDLHQSKQSSKGTAADRVSTYFFWVDQAQTSLKWSKSLSGKPRGVISLTELTAVEDLGGLQLKLTSGDAPATARSVSSVTIGTSSMVEKTLLLRSFSLFLKFDEGK